MVRSQDGHPLPEGGAPVMRLEVFRFSSGKDDTLGAVFDVTDGRRRFLCFCLEDEYRAQKVHSETRIPAGVYELELRAVGGFHERYSKKFPDIHEGMIHVKDVPGFKYILWHIGNTEKDTAGCLLLGDTCEQNVSRPKGRIGNSTNAYKRVYPQIRDAIKTGTVLVEYVDADQVRGSGWVVDNHEAERDTATKSKEAYEEATRPKKLDNATRQKIAKVKRELDAQHASEAEALSESTRITAEDLAIRISEGEVLDVLPGIADAARRRHEVKVKRGSAVRRAAERLGLSTDELEASADGVDWATGKRGSAE